MPLIGHDVLKALNFWRKGEDPFVLVKKHKRLWKLKKPKVKRRN